MSGRPFDIENHRWSIARGCGCLFGYLLGLVMLAMGTAIGILVWKNILSTDVMRTFVTGLSPATGGAVGLILFAICGGLGVRLLDVWLRRLGIAMLTVFGPTHPNLRQFLIGIFYDSGLRVIRFR